MEYKEYLEKIKEILIDENIKYNLEELEKVVEYAVDKHKNKKIINEDTIDFVIEVASEVATLRLDDKSIYAALLYPIAEMTEFNEHSQTYGFKRGILILKIVWRMFAPSICAASVNSCGIPCNPARYIII